MGSNISKQIDEQSFKQITEDVYTPSLFKKLKNPGTNTVSQEELLNYANSINDAFITHNWSDDSRERNNHLRVAKIVKRLQELGLKVWFDGEQMKDAIQQQMCDGIDSSRVVIVCVTELYIDKVAGKGLEGARDNCLFEFRYACDKKAGKIIPIVMDDACKTSADWHGPVGGSLGGTLYYPCWDDAKFEEDVQSLYKAIIQKIKVPILDKLKAFGIEPMSLNSVSQGKFLLNLVYMLYTCRNYASLS